MKITDYAPRAAPFDSYLTGRDLKGAEVGCDVGAHAEAMLRYCSIKYLYLIDTWTREYYKGYCTGRIHAGGWKNYTELMQMTSDRAALLIADQSLDFVYIDITHDYPTVRQSLDDWWPKLKSGGVLGYRNYAKSNEGLMKAVDEFIFSDEPPKRFVIEASEIVIFKAHAA